MACRTKAEIAAAHLLTPCVVLDATRTKDGAGGTTVTYVPGAAVVCRAAVVSGDQFESAIADRLAGRPALSVKVPIGTPVNLDSRVRINGMDYEVVAAPATSPGGTLTHLLVTPVGDGRGGE